MGKRSSFFDLPAPVQREIEQRLAAAGFKGYVQLAEDLRARGFAVSKSALNRVGMKLEARVTELRCLKLAGEGLSAAPASTAARTPTRLKTIGARLRFERARLGFSQSEIAQRAGIPLSTYKKYELDVAKPGGIALARIGLIGIDLTWLLTGQVIVNQWSAA